MGFMIIIQTARTKDLSNKGAQMSVGIKVNRKIIAIHLHSQHIIIYLFSGCYFLCTDVVNYAFQD